MKHPTQRCDPQCGFLSLAISVRSSLDATRSVTLRFYPENKQGPVPFPHVILERSEESHVAGEEIPHAAGTTKHGFVEGKRRHGLRTPKSLRPGQTTPVFIASQSVGNHT